jgi:hypothetical protein
MKTRGVRILDLEDNCVSVSLPDILKEITSGDSFYWSILYLDAIGHLGEGKSMPAFEEQIIESRKGFFISWDELNLLSEKFRNLMDIILIGCKNKELLQRYENDVEMYETCDITIELFDSCYWEVFSKDESLIARLAKKFKDIKFLEPDFEK